MLLKMEVKKTAAKVDKDYVEVSLEYHDIGIAFWDVEETIRIDATTG